MSKIQIFNHADFGEVRTLNENGTVLFCGIDVAKALGYSNPRDALNRHCRGVVKRDTPTTSGEQERQRLQYAYAKKHGSWVVPNQGNGYQPQRWPHLCQPDNEGYGKRSVVFYQSVSQEMRGRGGVTMKLLSRLEAAERLGVSHDTLDRLRAEGKIAYIQHKPGGKVWISEDAIAEYIARVTHPAEPVRPVLNTYRKRRATA